MPRRRLIPVLMALGLAGASRAEFDARVMTDDLAIRHTRIVELNDTTLTVRHLDGSTERIPTERLSAAVATEQARPALPGEASSGVVFVELTDGQRLLGTLGVSDDPNTIVLEARGLGRARLPLERVRRVARPGAAWRVADEPTDAVLLTNGDRLTGFVASLGSAVTIEPDAGPNITVPMDRVAEVRLANPSEPSPGTLVGDDRGVVLRAQSLRVASDGAMTLTTRPAPLGLESGGEDTVAYNPGRARFAGLSVSRDGGVVALGTLDLPPVTPTGGRRWTPDPVVLDASDPFLALPALHLPAPGELVYPLPPGADRFACDLSVRPGVWTDCVVRIEAIAPDGTRTTLGTPRLNRDNDGAAIESDLPARAVSLVITVDPGEHGAVQDAVTIGQPRLRVR
ncbi:MAG: hypothetical protein D6692_03830 [Planctomycetota bacterium]|nr:MAG: hypothetical protein D6692_03830 [Planctomycetota bacterium]